MQMIFQDPFSSLNPRMTLFEVVSEPMVVNPHAAGPDGASRAGREAPVAHDLSVVKHISDRVAVMYVGKLLSAVPKPDPRQRARRKTLAGEVADPAHPPPGCYFHPRCPTGWTGAGPRPPPLREVAPGQLVSCHLAEELDLTGVA